ncbi:MAG: serine hydrolase [Actinomycetales bacterium]|nr:serine hydrolase [Actinomycetales bacterium]
MKKTAAALVGACMLVAACASPAPVSKPSSTMAPAFNWERVSPKDAGFDTKKLNEVFAETDALKSACLVVVKDGKLVVEKYWRGEDPEKPRVAFSVTKSVVSTLVGIAQDDGDLRIIDRASQYIPEWNGTDSETVTVRNLLANDSGRKWDPKTDYSGLFSADNMSEYAVGLGQMAPPGKVWAYNNSAIQTLDRILIEATGRRPYEIARDRIFEPLGMSNSRISSDSSGQSTGMSAGMLTTCMDLARFGLMIEQGGVWQGQRIVSEEWIADATGRASQKLNAAYGYLWWLNRAGDVRGPLDDGSSAPPVVQARRQLVPGGPKDMFSAMGFGGQIVLIDPASRTVVVRMGDPNVDGQLSRYDIPDAARVVTYALK